MSKSVVIPTAGYLTSEETCKALGIHIRTLGNLNRRRVLTYERRGKRYFYPRTSVDAYRENIQRVEGRF